MSDAEKVTSSEIYRLLIEEIELLGSQLKGSIAELREGVYSVTKTANSIAEKVDYIADEMDSQTRILSNLSFNPSATRFDSFDMLFVKLGPPRGVRFGEKPYRR